MTQPQAQKLKWWSEPPADTGYAFGACGANRLATYQDYPTPRVQQWTFSVGGGTLVQEDPIPGVAYALWGVGASNSSGTAAIMVKDGDTGDLFLAVIRNQEVTVHDVTSVTGLLDVNVQSLWVSEDGLEVCYQGTNFGEYDAYNNEYLRRWGGVDALDGTWLWNWTNIEPWRDRSRIVGVPKKGRHIWLNESPQEWSFYFNDINPTYQIGTTNTYRAEIDFSIIASEDVLSAIIQIQWSWQAGGAPLYLPVSPGNTAEIDPEWTGSSASTDESTEEGWFIEDPIDPPDGAVYWIDIAADSRVDDSHLYWYPFNIYVRVWVNNIDRHGGYYELRNQRTLLDSVDIDYAYTDFSSPSYYHRFVGSGVGFMTRAYVDVPDDE
jgi:hypothetical protein